MEIKRLLLAIGKGLYPLGEGGGETVAHDLLTGLSMAGLHCEAFGVFRLDTLPELNHHLCEMGRDLEITSKNRSIYSHSGRMLSYPGEMLCRYDIGYPVCLSLGDTFIHSLSRHMDSKRPDAVLIQAERADQIIDITLKKGIIPILYLHRELDIHYCPAPHRLPLILVNSRFVQNRLSERYGIRAELLYPAVNLASYRLERNSREYITMINPVVPKGIKTFLQIAADMPERRFLVVEGWGTPKNILQLIRKFPNITYMPRQFDIRRAYSMTHILLVPSQWEEPFGRVIVEAGAGGIPVIASKVGGIPEALGEGGILIDDYRNPLSWIRAIHEMEKRYDQYSEAARRNAERFDVKIAVSRLLDLLQNREHRTQTTEIKSYW